MEDFEKNNIEEYFENESTNDNQYEKAINRIAFKNFTEDEMLNNIDLDAEHLEKAFTNKKYYLAMKDIPIQEKKVLYFIVVQNYSLNKTSKILNLSKTEILKLKEKAIEHFKNNLKV